MNDVQRAPARQLCGDAIARGEPLEWFEELYTSAAGDSKAIPWADLQPNPHLVEWHRTSGFNFSGQNCLKVGCGLGDDCEYIQSHGGTVTGFDISLTAVQWCKKRFPQSRVSYSCCDLFQAPQAWSRQFSFVLEAYTLQVLPPDLRARAVEKIADFVSDHGKLLIICRVRTLSEDPGKMPWPLTIEEIESFGAFGLKLVQLVDFHDNESPPVHRCRALFQRA